MRRFALAPPRTSRPARALVALLGALAAPLASGCVAAQALHLYEGVCATEHEACTARCGKLRDPRDCELECDSTARRCQSAQGGVERVIDPAPASVGVDQVVLVTLGGPVPRTSAGVRLTFGGGVEAREDRRLLAPGATLALELPLPSSTRDAELVLVHAPGEGAACFLTLSFDGKVLAGRYAPPRSASLREEVWNLTPMLPAPSEGEPRFHKVFLYNNDVAGSAAPYQIGEIRVQYHAAQALAPPPPQQ